MDILDSSQIDQKESVTAPNTGRVNVPKGPYIVTGSSTVVKVRKDVKGVNKSSISFKKLYIYSSTLTRSLNEL